jgi:hypothetical protein
VTVLQTSHSYYLLTPPFTIILDVTRLLNDGAVRACPSAFGPAAVKVSHLQRKENCL